MNKTDNSKKLQQNNWAKIIKAIKAPHVTEKATLQSENMQYSFKVPKQANKILIKQALEDLYGKKVAQIKTINVKRKARGKTARRASGFRSGYKKAIVSFAKGAKIDIFANK
jgi:large subunit ribosomal protein L23